MLGKLQTYKLQPTKFYEKGHRCVVGRQAPSAMYRPLVASSLIVRVAGTVNLGGGGGDESSHL